MNFLMAFCDLFSICSNYPLAIVLHGDPFLVSGEELGFHERRQNCQNSIEKLLANRFSLPFNQPLRKPKTQKSQEEMSGEHVGCALL
jgi:hypothetical protein